MTTNNTYIQQPLMVDLYQLPEVVELPIDEVLACPTVQAAFRLSFNRANTKRTDDQWANLLQITPGAFHAILYSDRLKAKRVRNIPPDWFTQISLLTGNNAVGQWAYHAPRRQQLLEQIERKQKEIEQLRMSM